MWRVLQEASHKLRSDLLPEWVKNNPCSVGVPQGSVLGPLLFSIYTSPISTIANSHQVSQQQYADNTQLYVALCQPITAKTSLHLSRVWTILIFGFVKMAWPSIQQNQSPFCLAHQKGSNLFPVSNPVTLLVQTSNSLIQLRSWGHARLQTQHGTSYQGFIQLLLLSYSIVQANSFIFRWWYGRFCRVCTGFIASRSSSLDQVNSILYGAASKYINRHQCIQNALARVVTYQRPYTSTLIHCITPKHWMWVHFKLATLAYKALHTGQPPYLSELLQHYEPMRTLRSSCSFQLSVPRHNLEFGSRAFRISAPKIWNLLPASIRNSPSLPTFRRHLKHIIFSQPILTHNDHPLSTRPDS